MRLTTKYRMTFIKRTIIRALLMHVRENTLRYYTPFIHRTTAVEKINEQEIQLHKRTNNTNAHQRIKH